MNNSEWTIVYESTIILKDLITELKFCYVDIGSKFWLI